MRIPCPICGDRDAREFSYMGHASMLNRPEQDAGKDVWNAYLHERANIAGDVEDLWCHDMGCAAWIVVRRNTISHTIYEAKLANEVRDAD